jgi:hypothetical protein
VSSSPAITITSRLASSQRPRLEQLLFFNANQYRVRDGIQESIAVYGAPEIVEQDGWLRICVGDREGVQSLFAVAPGGRPVGLAVYLRTEAERFVVLHLGVASSANGYVNSHILLKLMHGIRSAAKRTRGVDRIELVYKRQHTVNLNF